MTSNELKIKRNNLNNMVNNYINKYNEIANKIRKINTNLENSEDTLLVSNTKEKNREILDNINNLISKVSSERDSAIAILNDRIEILERKEREAYLARKQEKLVENEY